MYLARIAALDRDGPALKAVLELAPDALIEAERCDRERSQGALRGPLHGIPALLKDNIATADQGRAWSEPTLINLAFAFEQATTARQPPQFLQPIWHSPVRCHSSWACVAQAG